MRSLVKVAVLVPVFVVLAGSQARSSAVKRDGVREPSPSTIEAHLNEAEAELGIIMDSLESGRPAEMQSALLRYSKHLSRVHVGIGLVDRKGNRRYFLPRIAGRLESHLSDLSGLVAKTPSKLWAPLAEALGHVEGAVAIVGRAVEDGRGRFALKISGYADPPALPWRANR